MSIYYSIRRVPTKTFTEAPVFLFGEEHYSYGARTQCPMAFPGLVKAAPMTLLTPVSLITGFLGSGKTTVLSELLARPDVPPTAILMNEFGEIGIDNDLIVAGDDQVLELVNGCICCAMQEDLVTGLGDLMDKRASQAVPHFDRVAIETTGLADPLPILRTLMSYPYLTETLSVDTCVTTVDAVNGARTLDEHGEAVTQVAVADRILLTKSDLVSADIAAGLEARIGKLAPGRDIRRVVQGKVDPAWLLGDGPDDSGQRALLSMIDQTAAAQKPDHTHDHAHAHDHDADSENGVQTFTVVRDRAIRGATFETFLSQLMTYHGPQLLRVKGIVHVAERPDNPAVFHGVQTVLHPPAWLEQWPSDDRRTRIVFITQNLARDEFDSVLATLDQ